MLSELYIKNLTLIDELSLIFGPGLSVLTGETGAGKSILLDAIFLAVGGRGSVEHIRDKEKELDIYARFSLNPKSKKQVDRKLAEHDLSPLEECALLVRRVIARNGRHRQYINGMPVTVSQLREIAEPLVDFTGQHAQHALLSTRGQLSLLDSFAQNDKLLEEVSEVFAERKKIVLKKRQLDVDERTRANRIDWLKYQIDEIEKCGLKPEEIEELTIERAALMNAKKVEEATGKVLLALTEGSDGDDVMSRMLLASRGVQALRSVCSEFESLDANIEEAKRLIDTVCVQLEKLALKVESDPERLRCIEDRMGDIKQLYRKHGDNIEEIFEKLHSMQLELQFLQDSEKQLENLVKDIAEASKKLIDAANRLTESRTSASKKLAPSVKAEIAELGMPEAIFDIELQPMSSNEESPVSVHGADAVRFLFSANPGESARPLEKVASGGEISRVMLGIKRVLMSKDTTMVSVFDEVDSGVGGSIAHAIGEKLKAISKGRQVLCVSHLAQVAALADDHFRVVKNVNNGRTTSSIVALNKIERVEELARMMGSKEVTDLTRKHASEFLMQAGGVQ